MRRPLNEKRRPGKRSPPPQRLSESALSADDSTGSAGSEGSLELGAQLLDLLPHRDHDLRLLEQRPPLEGAGPVGDVGVVEDRGERAAGMDLPHDVLDEALVAGVLVADEPRDLVTD